jgi:hypothetical protein
MTRGLRNNNPLNIRSTSGLPYLGEVRPSQDGSFRQFEAMGWGYRAAFHQLNRYIAAGTNTINKIVYKWAPPEDNNDSAAYVATVASRSGINKNTVLSQSDPRLMQIVAAMSFVENQTPAVVADVKQGFEWLPLKKKF